MLKTITRWYGNLLSWLLVASVAILVVPVSLQIFSRYTELIPSYIWTEEMARFFFIWSIMIGAMVGIREGTHFVVDLWPAMQPRYQAAVRLVSALFVLVFAAAFLRKVHLVADQLIRRDRRQQSQSRINYLQNTLQKTANPDHRRGIADLLMQQEHIQMLANLDEPYAAIVVEPPSSTPQPVWPDKTLLFGVFALLGGATGYFVRMLRHGK